MKQTIILFLAVILSACNCKSPETRKVKNLYEYNVEEKIKTLGIELVEPEKPVSNYVGAVKSGNLIFLSGKISKCMGMINSQGCSVLQLKTQL